MRDAKLKNSHIPLLRGITCPLTHSCKGGWEMFLGSCVPTRKNKGDLVNTQLSLSHRYKYVFLKNDLSQVYSLEQRWSILIKRIVIPKVYKRLWIYLWSLWYKINTLIFLEACLILALVVFMFPSGILSVVDISNNVGPWFMCYFS